MKKSDAKKILDGRLGAINFLGGYELRVARFETTDDTRQPRPGMGVIKVGQEDMNFMLTALAKRAIGKVEK